VAIYPIDTLGLTGGSRAETTGERITSDPLAAFALNTGGEMVHGTNDLAEGLSRIERQTRVSYVLAFRPSGDPDGRFHSIVVKVDRKEARVQAKEGYLWMREEEVQERRIRGAFLEPSLFHELQVAMEPQFYLMPDGRQAVELALAVPEQSLSFHPRSDRLVARLDVGLTFRTSQDAVVDQFSRGAEILLPVEGIGESEDLTLLTRREIPPGDYEVVAVVSDSGSGQLGAVSSRIKVPSLTSDRIAMSSLVLYNPDSTRRRADLDAGIGDDAQLAVPEVRRIFHPGVSLVASSLVYHPRRDAESGEARVRVKGVILRGKDELQNLPTSLHVLTAKMPGDTLPLKIPITLANLEPGVYTLEIQALDEIASRGVIQHLDFVVR